MSDNLTVFGTNYTNVTGIKVKGTSNGTLTYIRPTGTKSIISNGTDIDVANYASVDVAVPTGGGFEGPTFTATYDSEGETLISFACDMTYAECVDYLMNSQVMPTGIYRSVSGQYSDDSLLVLNLDDWDSPTEVICTMPDETPTPEMRFTYASDGTLSTPDWDGTNFYWENLSITQNGTYYPNDGHALYEVVVSVNPTLQSKTATPTESQQTVTPDSGYDGLSQVTVGAISSSYVGSGITRHSQNDITVSGDTVTVPDGYYAIPMSKSVAPGTAGTPTATKGSVSNHAISVTPSVTNTTGYITGGTKSGTAVSVSASELVSGTLSITENGTTDVTNYASVNVNVSGGGGGSSGGNMSDPIRFFDYDGTLVASYSAVPESLPSIPTHDKLTNGTWNYTLAQIATQFNAMGTCDVGANYDTISGATEIDIVLQEYRLHPYLSLAIDGTVTIDWGDNSADTATGTSLTIRLSTIHHEYATAGNYTIKITKTSGTGYSLYCSSTYPLLNKQSSTSSANRIYSNCVQAVRVGEDCVIGTSAFNTCYSLTSVSIPSGITSIRSSAFSSCHSLIFVSIPSGVTNVIGSMFYNCYSLAFISIPSGVTSIGSSAFYNCSSLASISIPSGVTSIDTSAFSSCYSLASILIPSGVTRIGNSAFYNCSSFTSISIPSGVTSIGSSAFYACYSLAFISIPSGVTSISTQTFYNCYGMAEYHFESITPPTLPKTNAFTNIQSDCAIYVPAESLTAYQEAENWSTYASYMVGE